MDTNKDDSMNAEQILEELRRLAERERSKDEPTVEMDTAHLDDAIASLEKFVAAEKKEPSSSPMSMTEPAPNAGIVDTGVLTGPIGGLKNFLVKKAQDNQA